LRSAPQVFAGASDSREGETLSRNDIDESILGRATGQDERHGVAVGQDVIDLRAPARTETERAVRAYRDAHSLSGGPFPQVQGLLAEDVRAALADERTVTAGLRTDRFLPVVEVPVLTPIDLVTWYSSEFRTARFGEQLAAGYTCWHLSTFPAVPDDTYEELLGDALDRLRVATSGGIIIFADHAERDDDPSGRRLAQLLARECHGSCEELLQPGGPVREHYLAGVFNAGDGGRLLHSVDLRTRVTGATDDERFLDELWAIYERPFKRLAEKTPLRTYFDHDELAGVLGKDGAVQISHRENDRLVSWAMMTTSIESFPWMDPQSFRSIDPTIPPERTHVFPGLVTDEEFRGNHCTDKLIAEIAFALEQQGPRHLIVFETLDENVDFLPRLIEDATEATGYGTVSFRSVGAQRFHAWSAR